MQHGVADSTHKSSSSGCFTCNQVEVHADGWHLKSKRPRSTACDVQGSRQVNLCVLFHMPNVHKANIAPWLLTVVICTSTDRFFITRIQHLY